MLDPAQQQAAAAQQAAAQQQQQAAAQQQMGQMERMVRGVGEPFGEAFARRLREDAIDTKLFGRPPPRWNGDPAE